MKTPEEILDAKESYNFLKGAKRQLVIIAMKEYARQSAEKDKERRETLDSLFDKVSEAGKYDSSYVGNKKITAKEIVQMVSSMLVNPKMERLLEDAIIQYAKEACKQQREICAKSFPSHEYPEILKSILNAPEPNVTD